MDERMTNNYAYKTKMSHETLYGLYEFRYIIPKQISIITDLGYY